MYIYVTGSAKSRNLFKFSFENLDILKITLLELYNIVYKGF